MIQNQNDLNLLLAKKEEIEYTLKNTDNMAERMIAKIELARINKQLKSVDFKTY